MANRGEEMHDARSVDLRNIASLYEDVIRDPFDAIDGLLHLW